MRLLKIFYLNISFYFLFVVASLICIPILALVVAFLRPFSYRRDTMRRVRRFINLYGRIIAWLPFPLVRVYYEDHSGGSGGGPYIFVCNHRSTSDAFLIAYLPVELVQVVNVWPFHIPILGICARLAGYLDINSIGHETFFLDAARLLEQGVSIVFFPEGTRSASKTMGNFHGAAFRLALETKLPIVPLCISGTENIPQKGSLLLHPGVIRIRRLPEVPGKEAHNLGAYALKNMVRNMISRELSLMEGMEGSA